MAKKLADEEDTPIDNDEDIIPFVSTGLECNSMLIARKTAKLFTGLGGPSQLGHSIIDHGYFI